MNNSLNLPPQTSPVIIHLFKGVLYGDQQPLLWRDLLTFQAAVRDYFSVIGLDIFVDETENYAFVRQSPENDNEDPNVSPLPRLIQRRPLSYPVSLLCILLRKKLIEADAEGAETRVILSREQIIDMMRVLLAEKTNEAKVIEQIDSATNKVIDYGLLRRLKDNDNQFEIRRIIKALVDADWLTDIDQKLQEYKDHARSCK